MWLDPLGQREHLGDAGHLEIENPARFFLDARDVVILNVSPVFSKMSGYAISAGTFAKLRGGGRIRLLSPARLTDGRNVIDVDVEATVLRTLRGHLFCVSIQG